jgi:hypothetical protein
MTLIALAYEVRPRKDHRGVAAISDALPFVTCGMPNRMTQSDTPNATADRMMP